MFWSQLTFLCVDYSLNANSVRLYAQNTLFTDHQAGFVVWDSNWGLYITKKISIVSALGLVDHIIFFEIIYGNVILSQNFQNKNYLNYRMLVGLFDAK